MILEYAKVRKNVKTPTRSNPSDAGMDVFYCPDKEETISLPPLGKVLLPTGLKIAIPHGFALEIKNRSGLASKEGLVVGGCLVDPGYEGEIKVDIHNISQHNKIIEPGAKIAQFVIYPVVHVRMTEKFPNELFNEQKPITMSNRGSSGFGSTDSSD